MKNQGEKEPLVSVVVLNYNGKELLDNCLTSLIATQFKDFEILFVDNGSSDGSVDHVRSNFSQNSRVKLIENKENLGFAGGNNTGLIRSRGKYVVLLNNDVQVTADWLTNLVQVMELDPTIGAAQCKLLLYHDRKTLDSAGSFLTRLGFLHHRGIGQVDVGQYDTVDEIFSAKGAAIMLRRQVLEEIGLLDDDFFAYMEETDLCWRIWLSGYRVVFVPQSVVYHVWGATLAKIPLYLAKYVVCFHGTKNYIQTLVKNLDVVNLIEIMPRHIAVRLFVIIVRIIERKELDVIFTLRGLIWCLTHFKGIWRKRQHVQKRVRKVLDREIFKKVCVDMPPGYLTSFYLKFMR